MRELCIIDARIQVESMSAELPHLSSVLLQSCRRPLGGSADMLLTVRRGRSVFRANQLDRCLKGRAKCTTSAHTGKEAQGRIELPALSMRGIQSPPGLSPLFEVVRRSRNLHN